METIRLTVAQALIRFLQNQYISRDGMEMPFFKGCFGIFGHGNVSGIGQALQQTPDFTYYQARNEQAMVHTAIGYAKTMNRLQTFACTTSIGPGAMNMVTGALTATVNRIPVLLLPGDLFAKREPEPVLQQSEYEHTMDMAANDAFKPVSRYWDRINRPEQLMPACMAAMRVLTSPAETGAVTLSMPQDVQPEAWDFPVHFFDKKVWAIARNRPDSAQIAEAAQWIVASKKPLIIAGGGVKYSGAEALLQDFVQKTGIPVGETFAGKGSVPYDHPSCLGAIGVTGTSGANEIAAETDLVIGIGTRYTDFTTCSNSLFQNPEVRFININVKEMDAFKKGALPLTGDALKTLEELQQAIGDFEVDPDYRARANKLNAAWDDEVERVYAESNKNEAPIDQAAVIQAVNGFMEDTDIMVCAAGSLPGDLHKLWRSRDPKNFHLEYGNSCMGYEIAGGLGVKMAEPDREVYVMVGDGSWFMLNHEIVTSLQEGYKLVIVLLDNDGFASIGSLSESIGSQRFGTQYRYREGQQLTGGYLPVDLARNAESLGAHVIRTTDATSLHQALEDAKKVEHTTVIYVKTDIYKTLRGYNSWWDVPIAEVSEMEGVQKARSAYENNKKNQRHYL
jgi:3D-(3,5/4)-trihydroxycyclohexane-1,2-dione acylhydrolase (decyclizing)